MVIVIRISLCADRRRLNKSVSILLLLVNVETVDVDKMIPENMKQKKDKQRILLIVVF